MSVETMVKNLEQNVLNLLKNEFPIEYQDHKIEVTNARFIPPADTSKKAQLDVFLKEETLNAQVRGDLKITKGEEVILENKDILISNIPYPTERGTYIIGGNEQVFINQMLLRPGVYVKPARELSGKQIIESEVRAGKKRFTLTYDRSSEQFYIEGLGMDFGYSGKKIDAIGFLLFMGVSPAKIEDAIGNKELSDYVIKNAQGMTGDKVFSAFFDRDKPETDDGIREKINAYLNDVLKFDEKAVKIQKEVIGQGFSSFTPDAFVQTIKQIMVENENPGSTANIDDIRFKKILNGEDVVAKGVESGIFEWTKKVKERIRKNNVKSSTVRPATYIEKQLRDIYQSNLAEMVSSSNPLDLAQKRRKVTLGGPGGLNDKAVKEVNRNLVENEFGKIDPIETPQSGKLGITQHLAQGVEVRNGEIYSKFYKVNNGVIDTTKIIDDVDTFDEYDEYIAFYDTKSIGEEGNQKVFKTDMVRCRHKGDFIDVPKEKITLVDYKPDSILGNAAALVPFASHNDGSRMLMGASMQRQAVPLEEPDEPLVQTVSDASTGKTTEEAVADEVSQALKAPVAGTVTRISNDFIEIEKADGTKEKIEKLNYFSPGSQGMYINHKPVVDVGSKVKAGDLLAEGWQTKNGKLSLGKNTTVAYMPFEGYNHEDGVVVSESWAKKMSSEVIKTVEHTIEFNEDTYPVSETKEMLKKLMVSPAVLNKLDDDGIIKKGEKISAGDIFVGTVTKKNQGDMSFAERVLKRSIAEDPRQSLSDKSKYAKGYQRGTIVDVKKTDMGGSLKVTIKLLTFKELGEADKISGRHGNKGTISIVLPDDQMPRTADGKVVDLIFSPLAVPSRKNLGQLLEVNAGLVAEKKALKSYNVQNFDSSVKDKLMKDLEEIGIPDGKQVLINPKTGKTYENPVTVGPMYIMRLDHDSEKKIAASSFAAEDPVTGLPRKVSGLVDGDRTSPQTIGGMEFWSLTSAGAVHNIHEMTTLKSDGTGKAEDKKARIDIFNAIKNGEPIPEPVTPKTLKVLQDKLLATGVQMTPLKNGKAVSIDGKFSELMVQPMKHEFAESLGAKEIEVAKTFDSRTGVEDPNGLYSKEVFGEEGDKWGRISFDSPIPNPMFTGERSIAKPYEAMLSSKGIKQRDINAFVEKGQFIVLDPGTSGLDKYAIIDSDKAEEIVDFEDTGAVVATGPSALTELIKEVDLKEELRHHEQKLSELGPNAKLEVRSDLEKKIKTLSRAIDQDYKPEDFLMPFVPVLPVKYRQPVKSAGNTFVEDGITTLYQQLMKRNGEYKKTLELYEGDKTMLDKQALADIERERFRSVKNIVGTEPYVDKARGVELEGVLQGLKSKHGFIRDKMQAKAQNYSGRSVIIVAPELDLDEAGIPEDMAAEMFKPHIFKELRKQRFTAKEIQKITTERTPEFRKALDKVAKEQVVILNRAPSLHRLSTQAFKPVIRWDEEGKKSKAIGLNPLVTVGFNADFDGDSMAVHLPITPEAQKEARDRLMPSDNILNPTHGGIITEVKHEMQLGLYYLTRDKIPTGDDKRFKDFKELRKAYLDGEVKTYDKATVQNVPGKGAVTSTVGMHVFNSVLPEKYIDYMKYKNVKKKQIEGIIMATLEDPSYGQPRTIKLLNDFKTVGFKASTISAISIGVKDFDPLQNVDKDKLFDEANQKVTAGLSAADIIEKREELEIEKARYVKGKMEEMLKDGILGEDNHIDITLQSGARGKADQISAMGGIVGTMRNVSSDDIRPMKSALLDGARPDEFWDLGNDSRKGIYDRSVATSGPGALSRKLWTSNKQTMIVERDCGDNIGIVLDLNKPSDNKGLFGRVLLEDVQLKEGGVIKRKKNHPLTPKEVEKIRKDAVNRSRIRVRSPLTCKSKDGICQNCYGMKPGAMTHQLVPIGEPVGSIASQAIGEPAQQSIMKTFHTGGGGNNLSSAFEETANVLNLKEPANKAVVVEESGTITEIINDFGKGTKIRVDKKLYDIKKKPISDSVKVGVRVERGDVLTKLKDADGNNVTVVDPRDVLRLNGVNAAQNYLTQQLEESFVKGDISNIDRRHSEIVVNNMTNRAVVEDGGTTGLLPTSVANRKELVSYNQSDRDIVDASLEWSNRLAVIGAKAGADYHEGRGGFGPVLVKKGEVITEPVWEALKKQRKFVKVYKKQATFNPTLQGIDVDNTMMNDNWLDAAAKRDANRFIAKGTGEFAVDKLDNPLTRQMTGLKGNFGAGFESWAAEVKNKFDDILN